MGGHDFQPVGIKIFSKHRVSGREKKGGGLALGYATSANIKMEEININNNDILALEGRINNIKCRIVLCYFDCTKKNKGKDFDRNRITQKQVEDLMEMDLDTALLVLGDLNGRISKLETSIRTDVNDRMIESWIEEFNLVHLNAMDTCTGKYTFDSPSGKSAIDHILTNVKLYEKHTGMWIDEDKTMLNISDHNLVRAWFSMGGDNTPKPQKKPVKEITWISRDQDKIEKCAKDFKTRIGKRSSFKNCMDKIRTSVEHTMRKRLKKKPSRKKKEKKYMIKAAKWVDSELLRSINLRSKLSRAWRYARKREEPEQVLEIYKQEYVSQKSITPKLTGLKKSQWEVEKIEETWKRRE